MGIICHRVRANTKVAITRLALPGSFTACQDRFTACQDRMKASLHEQEFGPCQLQTVLATQHTHLADKHAACRASRA